MKNNIKNTVRYGAVIVVTLVGVVAYGSYKADFKNVGIECNYNALEWNEGLVKAEAQSYYEKDYLSCMRSHGYLLETVNLNR